MIIINQKCHKCGEAADIDYEGKIWCLGCLQKRAADFNHKAKIWLRIGLICAIISIIFATASMILRAL